MKQTLGPLAFFITILKLLWRGEVQTVDIEMDEGREKLKGLQAFMVDAHNIMHTMKDSYMSAVTFLNDGILELKIRREPF